MIILCFGDSNTVGFYDSQGGWVERLRRALQHERPAEYIAVYNLGISGNRACDVRNRFDAEVAARVAMDPDEEAVIIIAIGTNDAAFLHKKGVTRSSKDEYTEALRVVVDKAQRITGQVIVCGLSPSDEQHSNPVPWNTRENDTISYRNSDIAAFDAIAKAIAQEMHTPFVDIQRTFYACNDVTKLLSDGVHPNDKGHQLIANAVRAQLEF
jgi:lysophospholipase L1-like esterase